jgi:hypothetical protein
MRVKVLGLLILFCIGGISQAQGQSYNRSTEKRALLRSIIFPGWGQHYLGNTHRARQLITAEANLWLLYGVFYSAHEWYKRDYRAFAALHAGVSYRLKPDIYYYRLGRYDSIEDFNQAQLRSRNIDAIYDRGTDYNWAWDSSDNRERYTEMRQASLRAAKAASFIVGGMVINRAVAAIQVLFLSRKAGTTAEITLDPLPGGGRLFLRLGF